MFLLCNWHVFIKFYEFKKDTVFWFTGTVNITPQFAEPTLAVYRGLTVSASQERLYALELLDRYSINNEATERQK